MRKNVFGRQFKRDANERKALFKNLLTSLVLQERIETTLAKAKAVHGAADKLVTKAKLGGTDAYRNLAPRVNHNAVEKLVKDIAPRFTDRNGGYTRIIKTRRRVADNAPMALLEWTEKPAPIISAPKAEKKVKQAQPKTTVKATATTDTKKKTYAKSVKTEKKTTVKKVEAKPVTAKMRGNKGGGK